MDSALVWAALATCGGLVTACWGYIRSFYSQLISRVIVTFEGHESARECILAYCNHALKPSIFGTRVFVGWADYVRPHRRRELVVVETIGNDGRLYWLGWRPVWITRTSGTTNQSDTTYTTAKPIRLRTFRLGFNIDEFVQGAFDFVNSRTFSSGMYGPGEHPRFTIEYHSGSVGRPMYLPGAVLSNAPGVANGPNQSPAFAMLEKMSWRYLRWTTDDLGAPRPAGALGLLSLSDEVLKFVENVRSWLKAKNWYASRGLPWKLGALFYGPPGNGKTSLVRALGVELDMPIHVFDLATMLNDELQGAWKRMLNDLPAIALIDDIDCVFEGREACKDVKVTLNCLLNVIDGVERADGLLVVLTTNRPERLCDALGGVVEAGKMSSRPGRIDVSLEFRNPDCIGRRKIAERILADWPELIEEACTAGVKDSGAQFERRCIDLATPRLLPLLATLETPPDGLGDRMTEQVQLLSSSILHGNVPPFISDASLAGCGPQDVPLNVKRSLLELGAAHSRQEMKLWRQEGKG